MFSSCRNILIDMLSTACHGCVCLQPVSHGSAACREIQSCTRECVVQVARRHFEDSYVSRRRLDKHGLTELQLTEQYKKDLKVLTQGQWRLHEEIHRWTQETVNSESMAPSERFCLPATRVQ